jgi:hypothetical protein
MVPNTPVNFQTTIVIFIHITSTTETRANIYFELVHISEGKKKLIHKYEFISADGINSVLFSMINTP